MLRIPFARSLFLLVNVKALTFWFWHRKMSCALWCPFCLGLNVLSHYDRGKAHEACIIDSKACVKSLGNLIWNFMKTTVNNVLLIKSVVIYWWLSRLISCPHIMGLNTLRARQNCRHFADDIFKRIFLNENVWISLKIWLNFVSKVPINNIPAMVQIMVWRRSGDKPLSQPMMISLLTHICVTRPQWVKILRPKRNGRHFRNDILKCIFLSEKSWILNTI